MTQELMDSHKLSLAGDYRFVKGIPGFEHLKQYRLQHHNEVFSILSSAEESDKSFIVVNPFDFFPDYKFELPDDKIEELQIEHRDQVQVYCIVTWHSDFSRITTNLLAPIVLNTEKRYGRQIVLQNADYTTRHHLWTQHQLEDKDGV